MLVVTALTMDSRDDERLGIDCPVSYPLPPLMLSNYVQHNRPMTHRLPIPFHGLTNLQEQPGQ